MYCMVHYVICDYILNCVSVFVFTHNLVLLDYNVCTMSVLRIMLYLCDGPGWVVWKVT